ncbi:uncharacterized protein LOC130712986 [Lotus japonicus]|uniref:uncharacterized protein LOC130712986 n=1 Tax=Lotus japonicus TaxID=34305 RepID=UPI00258C10DF|nr:uncharacterized protein LOC130712986 [Lotus japonicus]
MDSAHGGMKVGWRLPSSEFLKLNVEGSYWAEGDQMGGGRSIRDAAGKWILGSVNHGSAFIAESLALRDGLHMAWNPGTRRLLCESDCKVLVDTLKPSLIAHHAQAGILHEIRDLLDRQCRVDLS